MNKGDKWNKIMKKQWAQNLVTLSLYNIDIDYNPLV